MKSKFDLIYIIPWFLGELFMFLIVPIYLVSQLKDVSIISLDGMVYASITYLLLKNLEFDSIKEFKDERKNKATESNRKD